MRCCAFLTMESLDGYVSDDALMVGPLEALGWSLEWVPWRRETDWTRFDLVVVRSTWDYHYDLDPFLAALDAIASRTRLKNDIAMLRWNARKTYLKDLQRGGVSVIPTWWGDRLDSARLDDLFDRLESDELVVKPSVGANAIQTHRISRPEIGDSEIGDRILNGPSREAFKGDARELALAAFRDRPVMVQPFMAGIVEEGEFSLFFFNGAFSHAVLKTPKARDFRVQEEHGGTIRAVSPEPDLLAAAQSVIDWLNEVPLYARIDLVRSAPQEFQVMEVELIEPSLYLRTSAEAPRRFAEAIAAVPGDSPRETADDATPSR